MKLFERMPDGVTVDGKFYKLDFDFRNVLKMLEFLAMEDLMDDARDYLALKCLTKHPRNIEKVLKAVRVALSLIPDNAPQGEKLTSFEQDAGLIRTAFRQEYGIDLFRERLHWLEFTELLQNLPNGNRYEEVLGIRARPIPHATQYNQKEREWLIMAKRQCALHLTEAEAAKKYERDVGNVFAGIMAILPKEEVKTANGE